MDDDDEQVDADYQPRVLILVVHFDSVDDLHHRSSSPPRQSGSKSTTWKSRESASVFVRTLSTALFVKCQMIFWVAGGGHSTLSLSFSLHHSSLSIPPSFFLDNPLDTFLQTTSNAV